MVFRLKCNNLWLVECDGKVDGRVGCKPSNSGQTTKNLTSHTSPKNQQSQGLAYGPILSKILKLFETTLKKSK